MSKELRDVQEIKEIFAKIVESEPKKNNDELKNRLSSLLFSNGIAIADKIRSIETDPKAMGQIKKKVDYLVLKYERPLDHLKLLIKEHKACLKRAKKETMGYHFDILRSIQRCEFNINEAYKIIKKGLEPEMAYEFIRESLERKLKNAEKAEKMAKEIMMA